MNACTFPGAALAAAAALLLAGCQGPGPKAPPLIHPRGSPAPAAQAPTATEASPVQSPPMAGAEAKARCVPRTLPRAPRYPDTDAALRDAGGAADRYQLMAAGRLLRMRRLADLEKVIEGCR